MPFDRPIPNSRPEPKWSSGIATLVEAEKLMQIAILLPSAAFIGWLIGAWADNHFHQHWIGLAGMVFGGISGLVHVIRLVVASGGDSHPGTKTGAGTGNDTKGSPRS